MDRATATSGAAMRYWAWADVGVEMQGVVQRAAARMVPSVGR